MLFTLLLSETVEVYGFLVLLFQHWSLSWSASSAKMKTVPSFTIASRTDTGMATTAMGMDSTATMDMKRKSADIMTMARLVMVMKGMRRPRTTTVMRRRSEIRDAPSAGAVETLSRCPSVLIPFLFRSPPKHC